MNNDIMNALSLIEGDNYNEFISEIQGLKKPSPTAPQNQIIIDEFGSYIEINGDPSSFSHLITKNNLKTIFSKYINFYRHQDNLIISSPAEKINGVETRKLINIDKQTIKKAIAKLTPFSNISNAEYLLILDLISGTSLKESAEIGKVTHHTRRSQFKSISDKMNINTQSEMVRNVVTTILSLILNKDEAEFTSTTDQSHLTTFLKTNYPDIFRVHNITLSPGHTLRMLDFGAIDGEVYIWLHALFLPFKPHFSPQWCVDNNIRIIMPLRDGYMEERGELQKAAEYLDNSVNNINVISNLLGLQKFNLIASIQSNAIALAYAKKYSDKIELLILSNILTDNLGKLGIMKTFINGLANLAISNQTVAKKLHKYYINKLSNPTSALKTMKKTVGDYEPDHKMYETIIGMKYLHKWALQTVEYSGHSLALDYAIISKDNWENLQEVTCPTVLIQGEHHQSSTPQSIRDLSQKFHDGEAIIVKDKGQFLYADKFEGYLELIIQHRKHRRKLETAAPTL